MQRMGPRPQFAARRSLPRELHDIRPAVALRGFRNCMHCEPRARVAIELASCTPARLGADAWPLAWT